MKRGRKANPELSPEITALQRLSKDGAGSDAAVRRRIALIAAERKLDTSETEVMMKGRWIKTFHLCQFAKKHSLSVDWLIGGDLKGRLRMARNEVMTPRPNPPRRPQWPSDEQTRRFRGLLAQMDPADYPAFLAKMREIVGKRGSATDGSDEDGAA